VPGSFGSRTESRIDAIATARLDSLYQFVALLLNSVARRTSLAMPEERRHSFDRVYYASLDDAVLPTGRSTVEHHRPPSPTRSVSSHYCEGNGSAFEETVCTIPCGCFGNVHLVLPSLRQMALLLSLYCNIAITLAKFLAYLQTFSLSVLAALLDSVLDVVSQAVLNYTEQHSSLQRSSALYPAGASRLEPLGVLTCAALMGMASFEVLKESSLALFYPAAHANLQPHLTSVYSMLLILLVKLALLWLCRQGAHKRPVQRWESNEIHAAAESVQDHPDNGDVDDHRDPEDPAIDHRHHHHHEMRRLLSPEQPPALTKHVVLQLADPTLEALAQDHWNDSLSNGVAALALVAAVHSPHLWCLDPLGAILISLYIIYSWFTTGKEQIEHLTGQSAPAEFIQELQDLANAFDDRLTVDTVRAYHFGPKFLVEMEIVMDAATRLFESHDLGMELQYEIEGREEVERCFVHIDYQARPYDEHVVSKVPELKEKYLPKPPSVKQMRSAQSI
jgi:cation diffusion facilitator family transporter